MRLLFSSSSSCPKSRKVSLGKIGGDRFYSPVLKLKTASNFQFTSLVTQKSRDSVTEFTAHASQTEVTVLARLNYCLEVLRKNPLPNLFRLLLNCLLQLWDLLASRQPRQSSASSGCLDSLPHDPCISKAGGGDSHTLNFSQD